MSCKIPKFSIEHARRLLTLLCFSKRPLTVAEVRDAMAVDLGKQCLNRQARLDDVESFYEICPGMIQVASSTNTLRGKDPEKLVVKFAHTSVHEYLISQQATRQQKIPPSLVLQSSIAHCEISHICLIYLMDHGLSRDGLNKILMEGLPFAQYAAWFWYYHYKNTLEPAPGRLKDLVLKLFKDNPQAFLNSVRLYNIQTPGIHEPRLGLSLSEVPSPIHYACFLGLPDLLQKLIEDACKKGETAITHLNKSHDHHGPAILAAAKKGHISILEILISYKVDLNVPGGRGKFDEGTALSAAAHWGHYEVVELLLDVGADPNLQIGSSPTALQIASACGREKIVHLLLCRGASANANTPGRFGTALHAACYAGNLKVVEILIKEGEDPMAEGGEYGTSLQAASYGGNPEIANLFLNVAELTKVLARFSKSLPGVHANFWKFFLREYPLRVTEDTLIAAANNYHKGDVILEYLLAHRGPNVAVELSVLEVAWENRHKGEQIIRFLLSKPLKTERLPPPFIEKVSQWLSVVAMESILLATKDKSSVVRTIIPMATESKEGSIWIETLFRHAREPTITALDDMSDREAIFYLARLGLVALMTIVISRRDTESIKKCINASDSQRRTPYYFAIVKDHSEMARFLREEYGAHL